MKFGQLIEYHKINNFLQKSYRKWDRETSSSPFFFFRKALFEVKSNDLPLISIYSSVPNNRPPWLLIFGKFSNSPILFQPPSPPPPLLLISKILESHKIKSHRFFVWNSKKVLTSYWISILTYIHATETIAL